ncbi:MAG: hypothetical protein LAQ69_37130 [Acidobacteriia bacterium]|nr:hypothetical protein [Terriglobia bacterium]
MDLIINRAPINCSTDRRLDRRYPIDAELEYKLIQHRQMIETGHGRTVNVSSSGIMFESRCALPPEMYIEVSIAWPARLVALRLFAIGQTVRSQGKFTAVTIERHMFLATGASKTDARPRFSILR